MLAIQINAEGIASKVDNTTYNTDKHGMITDINNNKSTIEQQADLIRSKVDATYVKGELGKIEVGGRNLLRGSNFRNGLGNYGAWTANSPSYNYIEVAQRERFGNVLKIVRLDSLDVRAYVDNIELKEGEKYTLSYYAKGTEGAFIHNYIADNDNRPRFTNQTEASVSKNWGKKEVVLTVIKSSEGSTQAIKLNPVTDNTEIFIANIKLEKGNKATDWTPALEDTQAEIESVEKYASEIEQTAKGIKQTVTSLETVYETFKSTANSTFKQQADLIEGKVSETIYNKDKNGLITDLQQHDSRITQNANKIESKVDSTYVVNAIDDIEVGGRNLASKSSLKGWSGGYREENGVFTLEAEKSQSAGIAIDDSVFVEGQHYVLSFKIRKLSGSITYMGGHAESFPTRKIIVNGKEQGTNWNSGSTPYPNDEGIYKFEVYLQHKKRSGANHNLYIQPNRSHYGLPYVAEIWDLKVEKGNKATDWTPAYEDIDADLAKLEKGVVNLDSEIKQVAGQIKLKASKDLVDDLTGRMSKSESSINVLSNEIDLKVNEDNIVSQINLKKEGIRIKGNLIELDGTTLIRSGIIQTAHIENAAITNAKLGRAVVDTLQVKDGAITNAKIASLNADKINAGSYTRY